MNSKRQSNLKTVHKFTQNAMMKFRPIHYEQGSQKSLLQQGIMSKVSSMLTNFLSAKFSTQQRSSSSNNQSNNKANLKTNDLPFNPKNRNRSLVQPKGRQTKRLQAENGSNKNVSKNIKTVEKELNLSEMEIGQQIKNRLSILQKISSDTFLIGNQNQVDSITISGIYEDQIDSEINWSLNIHKKINKLAVDNKKCLLALECEEEILIYRYEPKKMKWPPIFESKAKLLGLSRFILFLRDNLIGVFYPSNATIFQLEENNKLRLIFNKKYGISQQLELFQILKPIDSTLNIFFTKQQPKAATITLWRLQFDFKNTSNQNGGFKSLLKIYDIPKELLSSLRIDNFSKNIFIMNFKFQILAAKDGYIIDSANTNIQSKDSFLIYQNQHLLHVSQTKLHIYSFKIMANTKPNRIDISSVDSIQIPKDPRYVFFDCLEMLNGNFVLFYQINPRLNHKTKGEIEYIICATSKISIEQKLGEIFKFKSPNELKNLSENQFQKIQQKCDIAFKIGLSRRQVYLKLWNLSNKRDIQDYKFLLDTMDYETIKLQIQKKLKKASMSFNQVYKLEQSCFDMLRTDVFSNTDCTEQSIKNYLISHFLLRKLAFFRDIQQRAKRFESQQNKVFAINVQQYFSCVNMDLKGCLLDYAFKICFEGKDCCLQLRLFVNSFKFPLRLIYLNILSDLIVQSKDKLIRFLIMLPQMLPYVHKEVPDGEDLNLYEGLWSQIQNQQWKSSLYLEQITTLYNKDLVQEVTKSLWFKRNQYTLHDLVPFYKPKIIEMQELNSSDVIFYHFIDQIFRYHKQVQVLKDIIEFLEINYQLLPAHLKGKIFLYKKLFDYFKHERYYSPALAHFHLFLKLEDYELFKELFKYEKIKKGCLLKDAKSLYASIPNGNKLYNQALLNYFISDLSEVSDLKYILNRLNNQKRQFHIENESIYEVLVRAMQMKLRLGSENDVPFEEVMIYVQNIPFSKDNPIIEELNTVQIIGQCSEMFSKMKLNMTFLQIIQRCEDVLTAMINEQIKQKRVLQMREIEELKNATYVILAEIQTIKEKIYKGKLNNLAYFIYISRLMEEQHLIKDAKLLLEDKFLLEYYSVDDKIVENLVIYMYRWKLTKEPVFVNNKQYLHELLTLLPQDNIYKIYFQAEIQFSIMLSTPQHPIQFRDTSIEQTAENGSNKNQNLLTTKQIIEIVNNLPVEFLATLNLQRVYELTKTMQELRFTEEDYLRMTNLVQIYEAVIIRLIRLKSIRVALPKVRKLIQLYGQQQNYSIVFAYMILNLIMAEISENHKKDMAKIAFYTFNHPLKLLNIIEQLISNKFSNDEEALFIRQQLESLRPNRCYNRHNFLLDVEISTMLNEKEEKYYHKLEELIFQTWMHINNNRQDFNKNLDYTFYYICLLHNPYALAKYLCVLQDSANIRVLRSYLSYIFRQEIFNGINVLYFSRRMFTCLLDSLMDQIPIEFVISQYRGVDLQQNQIHPPLPKDIEDLNPFAAKLGKSIKAFSNKIDSLTKLQPEESGKKKKRIKALLSSEASINEKQVSEYPFNDSDDNYEADPVAEVENYVHSPNKVKRKPSRIFDANRERRMLMERKDKNLFLSCNDKEDFELRRNNSSNYLQNLMKSMEHSKSKKAGPRDSHQGDSQRENQLFHILDRIDRADSNPGLCLEEHSIMEAHSQTQDDFLVNNVQPILLEQKLSEDPIKSSNTKSCNPFPTLTMDFQLDSPIRITGFHKDQANQLPQDSAQSQECQFKININVANDEEYTPIWELRKQLLKDYGGNDAKPMFNLSLIAAEQQKQFGQFEQYLKQLIVCIYESNEKSLSFLLTLIKQIVQEYCEIVQASTEFLDYYISLESYNIKYKYHLPIRQMFHIEGIFLQSADPNVLFQLNKDHILQHVDFDNILLVAKLLHFSLKKSQIKDQLYFTYLVTAVDHYVNDSETNQEELVMQKQRIGGIMDQIATVSIFVERGELLLKKGEGRKEVVQLIKDSLARRKKKDVLNEFCLKFQCP